MTATYKYYRSAGKGYAEMVSKGPTEEVSCVGKELQDLEKCSEERQERTKCASKSSEE